MLRSFHAVLLGLIGAGIVHIVVLLLVPEFSERDSWSRLAMQSSLYKMTRIDEGKEGASVANTGDPLFAVVACRFDLAEGMVQIKGSGHVPFWSMAVYDRNGYNIYSLNDRSANASLLDVVVATPAQMIDLRKDLPVDFQASIFIEAPVDEGIVVVRAFIPDESWRASVSRFLEQSSCEPQ